MKEIFITAPVKTPEDIELFAKETNCRDYYVYHKKFLDNNFEYINEFIDYASTKFKVNNFFTAAICKAKFSV